MQLTDFKSRTYESLTEWEKDFLRVKGIINGCGGAGNNIKNRFIRWFLKFILVRLRLVFIEASCDIHDFSYWKGGDDKRRQECDLGFFQAIIGDIGKADLGMFGVLKYTMLALCFYYAVRIGGKDYFIYS